MRDRVWYTKFDAPFGTLFIAASGKGICRISLGKTSRLDFLKTLKEGLGEQAVEDRGHFGRLLEDLKEYFSGEKVDFDHPMDLRGATDFQRKVLLTTRRIPYGETRTYKEIAEAVGKPRAYRAVGQALGANPIAIIIPCHRVIGSDGGLVGFGGGESVKERLLRLEGSGGLRALKRGRAGPR